jgi:4-hydroxy-2-oxoheptanedioate aldolase
VRSTYRPRAKFGAWAALGSTLAVESLARSGADFVGLDLQHGGFGFVEASRAVQLLDVLGVECLVRLAAGDLPEAPRVLDYGADGLIVAGCDTAAIARDAVSLARYQPHGTRSYGGLRFGVGDGSISKSLPAVFVMIETLAGVENLAGIAAVPGLAGLFVGPADLALALGLALETSRTDSQWQAIINRVSQTASTVGIEAGMFATDGRDGAYWASLGFTRVVVGSDVGLLKGMAYEVKHAREQSTGEVASLPSRSS